MQQRNAAYLRVVAPEADRLSARDQARQRIKDEMAKLKLDSKRRRHSANLIAVLEACDGANPDPVSCAAAAASVKRRLDRLKTAKGDFDAAQLRDLLIIVLFGHTGVVLGGAREEACAMIRLSGEERIIAVVLGVYPGLYKLLELEV